MTSGLPRSLSDYITLGQCYSLQRFGFLVLVLGIGPGTYIYMLGKCPTTELYQIPRARHGYYLAPSTHLSSKSYLISIKRVET